MIENINWYPGHMKKTAELIRENLKAVDVVVEIVDSRIPVSSRNTVIDELVAGKRRLVLLNKSDLADPQATAVWQRAFESEGNLVMKMNSQSGDNIKRFLKLLESLRAERVSEGRVDRPLRMMVVGVPNAGKSSFINRLVGRKSARTGDRPGVTTGKQWVTLSNGMQLLDTPGILRPKFEDPRVGLYLAFCGSIKDEILDVQDLGFELVKLLQEEYPAELMRRYGLDKLAQNALANMESIALKRGFLLPGKRIDYERTGRTLLDEFRSGRIGRITLERPPEAAEAADDE